VQFSFMPYGVHLICYPLLLITTGYIVKFMTIGTGLKYTCKRFAEMIAAQYLRAGITPPYVKSTQPGITSGSLNRVPALNGCGEGLNVMHLCRVERSVIPHNTHVLVAVRHACDLLHSI